MPKKSFEQALQQLEQIVHELELGELSLDEAVKKFHEGTKYSNFCLEKLNEAEKQIKILTQDENGNITEEPFILNDNDKQ